MSRRGPTPLHRDCIITINIITRVGVVTCFVLTRLVMDPLEPCFVSSRTDVKCKSSGWEGSDPVRDPTRCRLHYSDPIVKIGFHSLRRVPNLCCCSPARAVFRRVQEVGKSQKSVGSIGILMPLRSSTLPTKLICRHR